MAYCFYNGVKLPELPSTAYSYGWIRKNDNTQHYDLILTKVVGYYDATAGGIVYGANQGTTEIAHYRIPYSGAGTADGWGSYQTTNTWMALDANRTVMWSNHYIPNGSLTATAMYFDAHEAIPEVDAYQIEKETVVGIADQVRRLCNTEAEMTPAQIESNLGGLNIDLMETFVISGPEEQVIYPDEGYYGFSKITVGAVDTSGGEGGDIVIGGGAAEDTTFGDDYYNVPTGNYDYSAGADENPSYIPEIPGTGYKALFRKDVVGNYFTFKYYSDEYELETDVPATACFVSYHVPNNSSSPDWVGCTVGVKVFSEEAGRYRTRKIGASTWPSWNQIATDQWVTNAGTGHYNYEDCENVTKWSGLPLYELGVFASNDAAQAAVDALAPDALKATGSMFVAVVSDTQIYFDGSNVNNADNSPMTIYECDAADANAWTQIGTTDGTDYAVRGYSLVWNSHDLKDMTGQFVTQSKSDDPIAEMSLGEEGIPVERNETYYIEGSTVNTFVGAAQRVTGGKTPLTPTDAALALDEYYAHPAEGMKW